MDGRRARGAARSKAIIDATLAVIANSGVAGVTHRAVAAQAGVSLASTTYHFATLEDLLTSSMREVGRRVLADQRDLFTRVIDQGENPVTACTDLILHQIGPQRSIMVAHAEMITMALRTPALHPEMQAWRESLVDLLRPVLNDETTARATASAMRGLVIDSLMASPPPTREELTPLVRAALDQTGAMRSGQSALPLCDLDRSFPD